MSGRRVAAWAAAALLAGCASKPAPAPRPTPAVRPAPPPLMPPPPPTETSADWRDLPLTAGDWSYAGGAGGSEAHYAGFGRRCEAARGQIVLTREGAATFRVRTSYGERALAAGSLPAADSLLDEIAFSRGRFTVEADGLPTLVVPAWPEPARVIEDCRV
jgi:hypothetical protein